MRRREFITLLGGVAATLPLAARAQQTERMRRIAILSDFSESEMQPLIATFRERMQQLGRGDDSIRIDTRVGVATTQFQAASAAMNSIRSRQPWLNFGQAH
jgi:glutathione S-transferase